MTTRDSNGQAEEPRDLRAELLRTSRALLDESGPSALSMREVARLAGCTHQAPYHHFGNREGILAELVAQGFAELADRLAAAHDLAESRNARATLAASGDAYVGFALDNPGVFRIMFRPDMCDPAGFPAVREAVARARAELSRLARITHGDNASEEIETIYWAHVHGLACLLLDGALAYEFPTAVERHAFAHRINHHYSGATEPGTRTER